MALPDNPMTSKEQYLANIAGQNVELPEYPLTWDEQYLDYIAKNGGGGGGGGMPDPSGYEDGTALVKVGTAWKPQEGYAYTPEGEERVAEFSGNITTSGTSMFKYSQKPPLVTFADGEKRIVTWEGTEYECECYRPPEATSIIAVGNATLAGGTGGSGEPFCIICLDQTEAQYFSEEPGTFSCKVEKIVSAEVHPFDERYIPSTIPTTEAVQDMIDAAIGDAIGGSY